MDDLKKRLANSSSKAGKLIVVDGVFSMEGDLADLPNIVELAKTYGADDSHKFINGVLDPLSKQLRELETKAASD